MIDCGGQLDTEVGVFMVAASEDLVEVLKTVNESAISRYLDADEGSACLEYYRQLTTIDPAVRWRRETAIRLHNGCGLWLAERDDTGRPS